MAEKDVRTSPEMEKVEKEVEDIKSFMKDRIEEAYEVQAEELVRMTERLDSVEKDMKDARRRDVARIGASGDLKIKEGRYAGVGLLETSAILAGKRDFRMNGQVIPEDHPIFADAEKARIDLAKSITLETLDGWAENAVKSRAAMSGLSAMAPAMLKFSGEVDRWKNLMRPGIIRAMDSTTAGTGDELVPTFEAAQLWLDVNLNTLILPALVQVPMPTDPFDWPTQLGNTNWYPTTENVQATTSDVATAKRTLTSAGLKTGVPFSDELQEDAIVNFASELRTALARNAAEVIDDVLLNADTSVTDGINSDGATINKSSVGKAQWLLGWDGLRHHPLVDLTGQGASIGAAVSASTYNRVLVLLEKYAIPRRPGDVIFITDPMTRVASLAIAELETVDSGRASTISSGELMNIYGVPIIVSEQMRLADTDGKVTDGTPGTTGSILGVNTQQWYVGFRRGITMETAREAGKGQTTLYVSFRIAFIPRLAATDTDALFTALAYNITKTAGS